MKKSYKTFIIIAILGLVVGSTIASMSSPWSDQEAAKQEAKSALLNQGIMNVLLIGIDARSGKTNSLSDTLMLASIDTGSNKVALISIPRDTRVKEGNHYQKINAYNVEGGPELVRDKVEDLLKVPIHYYALTNFSGFKDIVDILGGVTLDVEKRMYKPSEGINLKPGIQRLNGAQALAYCRFRDDALGDISRTERQQKFIKALAKEAMQPETLTKLPKLVPELRKYITTDIPVSKLHLIARAVENFRQGELIAQTLPGTFYTDPLNGASYWVADEGKLSGIVGRVRGGETVAVVEQRPALQIAERPATYTPKQEKPQIMPLEEDIPTQDGDEVTAETESVVPNTDSSVPQPEMTADPEIDPNGEWIVPLSAEIPSATNS